MRRQQDGVGRGISRRQWLRGSVGFSLLGASASGWLPLLAQEAAADPKRKRSVILLWMTGGPSQIDTFDPKPGHKNNGPFKTIDTSVPGIQIAEHLPKLAQQMEHCAIVRSMTSKEGDHGRASYFVRTGYLPQGPVQYPTLGSLLSHQLATDELELPAYVSVAPYTFLSPGAYVSGFLGPQWAPLVVGAGNFGNYGDYSQLKVRNMQPHEGVALATADRRLGLLQDLEDGFEADRPSETIRSHRASYQQAVRMMRSEARQAFELDQEPDAVREAYGKNQFGQGCLLARRLVERGVPFIEVSLNGVEGSNTFAWDTHNANFDSVQKLCGVLDPGWSMLLKDLKERGLLESTVVVWMGEFGRTPQINGAQGRDHFPNAWSAVVCGGGIRTGQVVGKTSDDGMNVKDRPVGVPDLLATIMTALGLDPMKQNMSNVGRPIRLADPDAKVVTELLA